MPAGGRELIPGVKGQYLSSGTGRGLGPFSFLVVACLPVEASVSLSHLSHPATSTARASLLPGAFSVQERKSECLPFSAASIQEIIAPFFLTKSEWVWQLLGRGP